MEIVKLTPRTHKGKNKLMEAALAMPETWGWTWLVAERRETIQAKGGDGPWLFLVPTGVAPELSDKLSRWVHEMADKDFSVMRSNAKVSGAGTASAGLPG